MQKTLQKRPIFSKEKYNFKESTNHSHPKTISYEVMKTTSINVFVHKNLLTPCELVSSQCEAARVDMSFETKDLEISDLL